MSALQWVAYILNEDWVAGADGDSPGVPGRMFRVPKPEISIRMAESQVSLRNQDHINITDGGDEVHEPASLGYDNETVNAYVDVTIRTTHRPPDEPDLSTVPYAENPGEVRFEGARDANNDLESYGGLRGEVQRLMQTYRLGDKEWDLVKTAQWRDEAGLTGKNHYRGTWHLELDNRLMEIAPPTP